MSCADEVVYQAVAPGEPEQNGRCCLNGVGVDVAPVVVTGVEFEAVVRVPVDGCTIGDVPVGPLVADGLELDVNGEMRRKIASDAPEFLSPVRRQLLFECTNNLRRCCRVKTKGRAYRCGVGFEIPAVVVTFLSKV